MPTRASRRRTFVALALPVALLASACTAYQPGWTFDPTIGQATGAPGGPPSGAGASAAAGNPSGGPSPSFVAGLPSASPLAGGSPAAGSPAAGTAVIQLAAKNIAFDQHTLTAPANAAFTIQFSNQDAGVPHNVAIYSDSAKSNNVFRGAILTGPGQTTYAVEALPAGTYYFQCDVHPAQMNGTISIH